MNILKPAVLVWIHFSLFWLRVRVLQVVHIKSHYFQ